MEVGHWQAPAFGVNAQDVLILVDTAEAAAGEGEEFIAFAEPAAVGIAAFQEPGNPHTAIVLGFDDGTQGGMIDLQAAPQMAQ
ncbi:MAG TPA: hypothetical protein PKA06_06550, partial [Gemmatales bacterium]|nr:hypothetical protein [Gemmatales bacterium]